MLASLVLCRNQVGPSDFPDVKWEPQWKSRKSVVYAPRPWIWSVVRDRSAQDRGIITRLFGATHAALRGEDLTFLMVADTPALIKRYQALGYSKVNSFEDPEDGPTRTMARPLKS